MSRLTQKLLDDIESDIQGSCQSLQQVADYYLEEALNIEYDDLSSAEEIQLIEYVEQRHFTCAECGWWCEVGDYADIQPDPTNGDICSDCGKSYDDEDKE